MEVRNPSKVLIWVRFPVEVLSANIQTILAPAIGVAPPLIRVGREFDSPQAHFKIYNKHNYYIIN